MGGGDRREWLAFGLLGNMRERECSARMCKKDTDTQYSFKMGATVYKKWKCSKKRIGHPVNSRLYIYMCTGKRKFMTGPILRLKAKAMEINDRNKYSLVCGLQLIFHFHFYFLFLAFNLFLNCPHISKHLTHSPTYFYINTLGM